ncbi:methylated-DNA--[protein]-cysteine S-methyltransferase [Paenibacillus sedimenti]|uniref:Methylated-DNA--protein-cysteine methyltransferase n=1 Tax=Paenibacillus sedimenti TaxID=2770274 RepID=A0A926QK88_9BACL|nr:methylated-DNA--[protein]-cysteine S-methyltransferase [Paenibacillus sedimenti]MBD0382345.1 methylated-DNA--[protein]-cysteine S-methyltransferase [Paenibacillus sedimenti]
MTQKVHVLHYAEISSPVGPLVLVASSQGLCSIEFGTFTPNREKLDAWASRWFGPHELREDEQRLQPIAEQLEQYFKGERSGFEGKLDLHGTDFQKKVWTALLDVPFGRTASYKDIAVAIGSPKAVRAVGGANNRNPMPVIIPCHRIIGAGGDLVGYGGGLDIKVLLLELEGINA